MKTRLLITIFLSSVVWLGAQDPDIDSNENRRLEDIFRSSEQAGEVPVSPSARRGKKRMSAPPGSMRLGCICMDDSFSPTRSSGACSGHGGVRFWLYRTAAGDTVRVLTERHERHPHALSAEELSSIVQKRDDKVKTLRNSLTPTQQQPVVITVPSGNLPDNGNYMINNPWAVGVAGLSLIFMLRMLLRWAERNPELAKDALPYLLRHRKRPKAEQDSEEPPAPRV